jgi:hypothetical protein
LNARFRWSAERSTVLTRRAGLVRAPFLSETDSQEGGNRRLVSPAKKRRQFSPLEGKTSPLWLHGQIRSSPHAIALPTNRSAILGPFFSMRRRFSPWF